LLLLVRWLWVGIVKLWNGWSTVHSFKCILLLSVRWLGRRFWTFMFCLRF